jgi:hypothetical protein
MKSAFNCSLDNISSTNLRCWGRKKGIGRLDLEGIELKNCSEKARLQINARFRDYGRRIQ